MLKGVSFSENIWFREQRRVYTIEEPQHRGDHAESSVLEDNGLSGAIVLVSQMPKPPWADSDVEMMGFLGAGNNPMVGMTVAVAVAVAESQK